MSKVIIGVAWTYANSDIHLGHICAYIGGDVLARFHRARGDEVLLVSGTDCHGTPTTERAIRENRKPEDIVMHYHNQYVDVFNKLGMSYDLYTLTMTPYHKQKVQDMILLLKENGFIYEKTEPASFCPKCNKFVYDREVEVVCPKCGATSKGDQCGACDYVFLPQDLLKGKCRICGGKTEVKDNTNLYFALSKFEEPLRKHFEHSKQFWRKNTVNETEKFLREGLQDRAVTRDLNWGVEVPLPHYDDKRIYVWIEAVWGYVTAVMRYCDEHNLDWKDWWLDDDQDHLVYMCHGKDNIVFHTIIFPALLMATKQNYCMPEHCVSTEFLNVDGEKMSKSKGNGLPMVEMLERFDPDSLRYFTVACGPEKRDSNFTNADFYALHNGEIVNKFGNFVNRTLNFKGLDGVLPQGEMDKKVKVKIEKTYAEVENCILHTEFKEALSKVMALVDYANKYYDDNQPWALFKEDDKTKFSNVIYTCVQIIVNLSNLIDPFMPHSAAKIRAYLHKKDVKWQFETIECGKKFGTIEPLFTRLVEEKK